MKIIKTLIFLFTLLMLSAIHGNTNGGYEKVSRLDSIYINGIWRTYQYHKPLFPSENPRLIMVLHGDAMTSKSIQTTTGFEFNRLADKTASTIVVYPQGFGNYWNDCRKEASFNTKIKGINDVIFIKSIIRRMQVRHHIDYKNVFAVGYFNGADMCYKLAKSIPNLFKGFAIVGAKSAIDSNDDCISVRQPVSMMVINYKSDALNPYKGEEITYANKIKSGEVLSTRETINYWLNLLRHEDETPLVSTSSTSVKINSTVFREDYFSQEKNKIISLIKIVKGDYHFPNSSVNQWSQIVADENKGLNIPETVVKFFYQVQYLKPIDISELSTLMDNP